MSTILRVRTHTDGTDRYGDAAPGPVERRRIPGAFTAPRPASTEVHEAGRDAVIVGLSLFAPKGTQLAAGEQIEVDGVLYEIEGEPGVWRNPLTSWTGGVEAALKRVDG